MRIKHTKLYIHPYPVLHLYQLNHLFVHGVSLLLPFHGFLQKFLQGLDLGPQGFLLPFLAP